MPNTFIPPAGTPTGVGAMTVGPTAMQPPANQANPLQGLKAQADGLTQALMMAKLRQGKLGVPTIPGQVPGASTQPGITTPADSNTP
jgi:hypothetical protein